MVILLPVLDIILSCLVKYVLRTKQLLHAKLNADDIMIVNLNAYFYKFSVN